MLKRKRSRQKLLIESVFEKEANISPVLYEELCSAIGDEPELVREDYLLQNKLHNEQQQQLARILICDLLPGLKHHSIHCVSVRECMSTVIGLDIVGFGILFSSLRVQFATAWPKCPETLGAGETHTYCERRFKLFLCLYRLKQGATFQQMEITFGWSASILQEWFDVCLRVLDQRMHQFHEGFLAYKGEQWQAKEITKWWYKHKMDNTIHNYVEKVNFQNSESRRHGGWVWKWLSC